MKRNKTFFYITFLLTFLLILVPSTYKVIKKHNERLLENTIKKIEETAKDCYYNNSCVEDRIPLSELYEKTGLTQQNNPITKKVYNESSYVSVKDNFLFIEVE